ncbi:Jag family protein [Tunturibacter empetritectus]|uniref:SpoIIIJ-associated protein n=2 Tax=Tunturiibacter empetritectus TaxID=3069691 RepID=A0A7W8IJV7_9BACT|nr:R3H domain-containing nucleic acid-binding protein [Edaphobacter lichenicola]MBB5318500.1 spoIIIJ-associated protein [Edaphobacter lichenicola]
MQSQILACNGHVQPNADAPAGAAPSALPGASAPDSSPVICVEFTGTDTPLLLARNGELLHAIEHLAAKILRLEPEEHDLIFFDAEGFKANRDRELQHSAETAIEQVRATGRPYSFPPMTSRERRMLHLALAKSGLPTASSGEGPGRFVVLYPEGPAAAQPLATADRTRAIRNSFRRR